MNAARTPGSSTAILDRLSHHCEVVSLNGLSHRLEEPPHGIERETEVA
ncbi:ATP-binding protein [Streptomyces sp. NPDC006923]